MITTDRGRPWPGGYHETRAGTIQGPCLGRHGPCIPCDLGPGMHEGSGLRAPTAQHTTRPGSPQGCTNGLPARTGCARQGQEACPAVARGSSDRGQTRKMPRPRRQAQHLVTPAQRAGEVPNERTAATIAWTQVWRQRSPRGLLRAGRPMAHAQKRQGGWVRTRTQAGAWQQPIARASMPPFGVLERCVGRLRSPPSLAARAALQWRPPPDGGARRRAESKAIAVEFGASCTCCARPVSAPGQCPARTRLS
mmetsp:Transcript_9584/g.22782  ORF Transcript_9584/g.22782 Transcript_9584/m.22782 type:complete len:251 (-) Transcript_9584:263-1015(-)